MFHELAKLPSSCSFPPDAGTWTPGDLGISPGQTCQGQAEQHNLSRRLAARVVGVFGGLQLRVTWRIEKGPSEDGRGARFNRRARSHTVGRSSLIARFLPRFVRLPWFHRFKLSRGGEVPKVSPEPAAPS